MHCSCELLLEQNVTVVTAVLVVKVIVVKFAGGIDDGSGVMCDGGENC